MLPLEHYPHYRIFFSIFFRRCSCSRQLLSLPGAYNIEICRTYRDLLPLREFSKLELLVIDSNRITSHTKFPSLPNLRTLWVNKNKIDNLALFIDKLVLSCPNLKFLSMLQNEACPNYFTSGTPKQYQDYRSVDALNAVIDFHID
jgi:hypothetical protein